MKALRYYGARDIRYEDMAEPQIEAAGDAIIKVTHCGICGSDLHIYHGHSFSEDTGYCVGHEAVGEVVDKGSAVSGLKVGDKVMISAAVGCGQCQPCRSGHNALCSNWQMGCYGLSSKLQGSQAEFVRVPWADFNSQVIPEGLSEEQALLMTDQLATAWFGVKNADVSAGKSVAVVGLGPIGLMAVDGAFIQGAGKVYAIDPVPERRAIAAASGAIALHPDEALDFIREDSKGHMVQSIIEAVGGTATIGLALRLACREATVSVIGVVQDRKMDLPISRMFGQGLTFRIGTCSVQLTWPELIPLVQSGRLKPEKTISHRLPLSQGAEAYRLFDSREAGAMKMVMTNT